MLGLFRDLAAVCNDREVRWPPRWSAVVEDCTPFEFSVAMGSGTPNIRVLVEAQADPASPEAYWRAGERLNEWLACHWDADLSRVSAIQDLFVPTDPSAGWAMWHGIDFLPGRRPLFKLYLNPMAHGVGRSDAVVTEALTRLGMAEAAPLLLATRGVDDVFTHFCLDLADHPQARVKVYLGHSNATLDELESRSALFGYAAPGDWSRFCRAIAGERSAFTPRPVLISHHFTSERPDHPQHGVLHLPLVPYGENDLVAYHRIRQYLADCGLPTETYCRCVEALTVGLPGPEQGLHSWISFQPSLDRPRVTVYFNPKVYLRRYGYVALLAKPLVSFSRRGARVH